MAPLRIQHIHLAGFLKFIGVSVLVSMLVWYGHFQARHFIAGPLVTLETPDIAVVHEPIVDIKGYTENITSISLNGKAITTNEAGVFNEPLVLPPGYTIMTIHAEDRYGHTTSLSRTFVYEPTS